VRLPVAGAVSSPTQRSLKHLREQGYFVTTVEYWDHFARKRRDLYGIWDLLAIKTGETLAVQTTSGSNVSARVKKIGDSEAIGRCREAGWSCHVHGWTKGKNGRYSLRVVDLS
jgi:hypothetical protein